MSSPPVIWSQSSRHGATTFSLRPWRFLDMGPRQRAGARKDLRAPPLNLADHRDVLLEGVLALVVEIDEADAHVHGGVPVYPDHLALDRDRRAQLGEVDHQVDDGADVLDAVR